MRSPEQTPSINPDFLEFWKEMEAAQKAFEESVAADIAALPEVHEEEVVERQPRNFKERLRIGLMGAAVLISAYQMYDQAAAIPHGVEASVSADASHEDERKDDVVSQMIEEDLYDITKPLELKPAHALNKHKVRDLPDKKQRRPRLLRNIR